MRRAVGAGALLTLVALAWWALPSYAFAGSDPLGSGTVKLSVDPSLSRMLRGAGVELEAKSPARLRGRTLVLPVIGGELDPVAGRGTVETEGVLLFNAGTRSVPLRHLVLETRPTPLVAKVGGSQLKVASSRRRRTRRAGFDTLFSARGLQLTAKVATRLNKKLHLRDLFAAGQRLGTFTSTLAPVTTAVLPQGRVTLAPAPEFLAKLKELFVSLNPIAPAELAPGPLLSFPILGGHIAPDGELGVVRGGGEFELLQLGGGQVFIKELTTDLGARALLGEMNVQPAPPYPGKLPQTSLFGIGPFSPSADAGARTVTVPTAELTLDLVTAERFNEAFAGGKEVFGAGDPLGALSFIAQGQ